MADNYTLKTLNELDQTFSLSSEDLLYILGSDPNRPERYKASANSVMLSTFTNFIISNNTGTSPGNFVVLNQYGKIDSNILPYASFNNPGIITGTDSNININNGLISLSSNLTGISKITGNFDTKNLEIEVEGSLIYNGHNLNNSLLHNIIYDKTETVTSKIDISINDGTMPIYNLGTLNEDKKDLELALDSTTDVFNFKLFFKPTANVTSISLKIFDKDYTEVIMVEPETTYYITVNIVPIDNIQYLFVTDIQHTNQ